MVHSKMKRTKKWSGRAFGDIFQKVATLEDTEFQMEMAPTAEKRASLHKTEVKLSKYWHIEEEYWK